MIEGSKYTKEKNVMVLSNSENVLHMIDEVYHVYEKIVLIMI